MVGFICLILGIVGGGAGMLIYLAMFTKSTITFKGK